MMLQIEPFDNKKHRLQVIDVWKSCFGYKDARNDPALTIDKKLAVDDGLFFVALENDEVVGTIMAGYDGHRGWLYSLAVIPGRRRTGIGARLLEHAEKELKELGCVKINLQLMKHNESLKELYLKCGYSAEERIDFGKEIPENIK